MAFVSLDLSRVPVAAPAVAAKAKGADAVGGEAVAVTIGASGLGGLEAEWREVSAQSPDAAVFLGFGFALAAARYHEAKGEKVATAVVRWSGRPAAILSVALLRRAGVTVAVALGDPVSQYSDVLLAAQAPQRLVGVALQAIAEAGAVDLFEFRHVRGDSPLTAAITARSIGTAVALDAPFADLTAAGDVPELLLAIAGAKQRRERARSRRRLAERGEVRFDAFRGEAAITPLREAFSLKSDRLARAGHFSRVVDDPTAVKLLCDLARNPIDGYSVVVARLSVGEAPAAYEVGLVRGGRFHAYLGVVAEEFAGHSPGKVAMEETLAWAKAEGLAIYDLLPPADRYKSEWSNGSTVVRSFVAPMTFRGRLYAGPWLRTVRPALRGALDRMPPSARRAAGRAAAAVGLR